MASRLNDTGKAAAFFALALAFALPSRSSRSLPACGNPGGRLRLHPLAAVLTMMLAVSRDGYSRRAGRCWGSIAWGSRAGGSR